MNAASNPRVSWERYDAVLFDLDGVVTPTAEIHRQAWLSVFAEFDCTEDDYLRLIDGKPRLDGVRDFLADRGVTPPEGSPDDPVDAETIYGFATRKNHAFITILERDGIAPYTGTIDLLNHLDAIGVGYGLVSSSRNAEVVLEAAGMTGRFGVIVDGNTTMSEGLRGKPAPDGYLLGASRLGVEPGRTIVVEDAESGVAAGAAGDFVIVVGVDRGAGAQQLLDSGATLVVQDLDELVPGRAGGMVRSPAPAGLDANRFPVDPWRLVETAHDSSDLGRTETIFAVANGYLGMRANPEEGRDAHTHGTYLNGVYESWDIRHAEDAYGFARTGQTIVNVPDAKLIKLYVDDEPLLLSKADLPHYERSLDFSAGQLRRELTWVTPSGKTVHVTSKRMVSLTHRHLAVMTFEVTLPDDSAPVVISSQTLNRQDGVDEYHVSKAALGEGRDPRKVSALTERVLDPEVQRHDGEEVVLGYRTANSGMTVACGTRHLVEIDGPVSLEPSIDTSVEPDIAKTVISTTLEPGTTLRVTKLVAYHSSTGVPSPELADRCILTLDRAEAEGFEALEAEQADYLTDFWRQSDIAIGGDPAHQQAIRWNLFQLAQATACTNEQSVPAKGVTAGGYDGHYFWDTEVYLVPYLSYTNPMAAKKVLRFRWKTLNQARHRAAELSHDGALYPWRTINGEECSAYYAAGTAQYHINAAIGFAIERYVAATNDLDFLSTEAGEILIETARLWAELGFFGKNHDFHIHRVTGPDEYTTVVNDNTYTNIMASAHLNFAVHSMDRLASERPEAWQRLRARTNLEPSERDRWSEAANAMFVPFDPVLGVHPQDANFLELEAWPWAEVPAEKYPLLLNFHPLVIYRHQVLKQADVVLATLLRPDRFTAEERLNNFEYYDPITTGDSSLSAGVQAAAAARVGKSDLAWDYFQRGLYLDLCDTHHNSADGVHIASAGGVWNAIVTGFLGFRDDGRSITLAPDVPKSLGAITTRIQVRGTTLRIDAEQTGCVLTVESAGGSIEVIDPDGVASVVSDSQPVRIENGGDPSES